MPLIIFDLDGTLIDSREDLADAVNEVRTIRGLDELPLQAVIKNIGDGQRKLIMRSIPEVADDKDALEAALADMQKCYQKRLTVKTRLYPGVSETLNILKHKYKLAIISNKPEDSVRMILADLGILECFSAIIGGGRCKNLKPHPESVYLAAELSGCTLENAWFVGDHRTDMGAAANAGIKACYCAYGFGVQDKCRADALIQKFSALTEFLM